MSTEADQISQRRVRPWIAALLTFLGLGVGLYYARRTRAAIWVAIIGVVLGFVIGGALYAYMFYTKTVPTALFNPSGYSLLDLIGLGLTLIVAISVWIVVAKRQRVEKAGPSRLFGYLAIFLLPLLLPLITAMAIRFTLVHPFRIPSGAMQPTLHVGDYVFVGKGSYGYSRFSFAPFEGLLPQGRWRAHDPVRGDLAVFRPVPEPDRDFINRIIGMPGDRVQMIDGVLHLNGTPVPREPLGEQSFDGDGAPFRAQVYRETLPNGVSYLTLDRGDSELDNTRVYTVPTGSYFMMGDDRDNSADSRVPSVVGYVPFEYLIGRVDRILPPA